MLHNILEIIKHTPTWAWAIFAWLIFIGVRSMKNRKIRLNGLLRTPATFLFFYVYKLTKIDNINLSLLSAVSVFFSIIITYLLQNELIIQKKDRLFIRKGSYSTLICGMITFFVRYFCEYKKATVGDAYPILELISSAIIGGFCVGRNLKFFLQAKQLNSKKSTH